MEILWGYNEDGRYGILATTDEDGYVIPLNGEKYLCQHCRGSGREPGQWYKLGRKLICRECYGIGWIHPEKRERSNVYHCQPTRGRPEARQKPGLSNVNR